MASSLPSILVLALLACRATTSLASMEPSRLTVYSQAHPHLQQLGEPAPYLYKTKYFKQRVDHFSFANNDFYQQRYLINDTYWDADSGGPIFFYTGNEGDIEAFAQNSGLMWDLAPDFKALLVFAEHRYYGKSQPYKLNATKPDPKLTGYLTSEQALADFTDLVISLKATLNGASKSAVIAFGGSYGGMLAAWFRIKFPHVCDGAIAASAPVAQFDTPCDAFGRIVTSDYTAQGKDCSDTIRKSWAAIDNITSTDAGLKWVSSRFKFCSPLKKNQVADFKAYLNNLWTNVAMMDYPYLTTFLMPLPGNPVKQICKQMMFSDASDPNENKTIIEKIFVGASVYTNYTGSLKCLKLEDPDQIGSSMWDYQACTEMVMPFCFNNENDMFEKTAWNYTQFSRDCQKKYGVLPRPQMASHMYGEKKLHGASNIVFSNGLLDPWSSGGVLRTMSKSVVSLIIPEGAHHLDLRAANPNDPDSVKKVRLMEKEYISRWVDEAAQQGNKGKLGPGRDSIIVGRNYI